MTMCSGFIWSTLVLREAEDAAKKMVAEHLGAVSMVDGMALVRVASPEHAKRKKAGLPLLPIEVNGQLYYISLFEKMCAAAESAEGIGPNLCATPGN